MPPDARLSVGILATDDRLWSQNLCFFGPDDPLPMIFDFLEKSEKCAKKGVFEHHINSYRFRHKSYRNFSVKIADFRWPMPFLTIFKIIENVPK